MDARTMSRLGHAEGLGGWVAYIPTPRRLKLAAGPAYDLSTGQAGPDANVHQLQR